MAQKVMYPGMVNSPETTITNGISESDTIIYVLDPARVPTPPNLMTLGTGTNAETVKVTDISGSAITVERGFQGIAKSWPAGTVIARNFTEYDHDAFIENINSHASRHAAGGPDEITPGMIGAEPQMSDEEKAYWLDKWALLDPSLLTLEIGQSWSLTVPSGEYRYVLGSWNIKINDGGRMEIRNPFRPFLLPGGATIAATGASSGAHALILNPFVATPPANPKKAYYDRLKRLKELQLFSISTSSDSGDPLGNFDALFPTDFENGLVVAIHVFDGAWVGLSDFTTHTLNLQNEISDSHQIRLGNIMYLPFKRSIHSGIRSHNARVDGAPGGNSDLASVCTVLYYKLPPDW